MASYTDNFSFVIIIMIESPKFEVNESECGQPYQSTMHCYSFASINYDNSYISYDNSNEGQALKTKDMKHAMIQSLASWLSNTKCKCEEAVVTTQLMRVWFDNNRGLDSFVYI